MPGLSFGSLIRGFAQVVAPQREARFGVSHIFAQPARACDWLHPQ
jgi:hypothetical protein